MYLAFGVETTNNLRQFTYGVCDLSRIVDDAIDTPEVETPPNFDSLMGRLIKNGLGEVTAADRSVALQYVDSLTLEQQDFVRGLYTDAVAVANRRTSAQDVTEYAEAINEEATVQCAALSVSESQVLPDIEGRKRYNGWLRKFILAGYYLDSIIDLPDDHAKERIRVMPTKRSRFQLFQKSLSPVKEAVRATPSTAFPLLASMAIGFHVPAVNRRFSPALPVACEE